MITTTIHRSPWLLIISNQHDDHVDFVAPVLDERKIPFVRLDVSHAPHHWMLVWKEGRSDRRASLEFTDGSRLDLRNIRCAWYRKPEVLPPRDSPASFFAFQETQAALEGLWEIMPWFWVSHPHMIRRAGRKLLQLSTAVALGFEIPPTCVTSDPRIASEFFREQGGSVVYKVLSRSFYPEIGKAIFTNPVTAEDLKDADGIRRAPCLLQGLIPKALEYRVTVIGNQVFVAEVHSQGDEHTKIDWRRDAAKVRFTAGTLPTRVHNQCVMLVRQLGLQFGAIDLIRTPDDRIVFLEINPNGQWAWIQEHVPSLRIREALADLFVAASSP